MEKTYKNIHVLLHDLYGTGGSLGPYADMLDWSARSMLNKTTIISNLSRAKVLRDVLDKWPAKQPPDEQEQAKWFELFGLLSECYEVVVDDLMLFSAFEIYAKSRLLRKGYVVHEIDSPDAIKKKQKKQPIHVRSVRAFLRQGTQVVFKESTLGIATLLSARYRTHFSLPSSVALSFEEVRNRRNLVHFHMGYSWKVDHGLLALVDHLDKVIPTHKKKRIRRSHPNNAPQPTASGGG